MKCLLYETWKCQDLDYQAPRLYDNRWQQSKMARSSRTRLNAEGGIYVGEGEMSGVQVGRDVVG